MHRAIVKWNAVSGQLPPGLWCCRATCRRAAIDGKVAVQKGWCFEGLQTCVELQVTHRLSLL